MKDMTESKYRVEQGSRIIFPDYRKSENAAKAICY